MAVNVTHVFAILSIIYTFWYLCKVIHRPKLYYASNPLTNSIINRCHSLRKRYWPLFLFHGAYFQLFLQGIVNAIYPKCFQPQYNREIYTLYDGQKIALDWIFPKKFNQNNDQKAIVIGFYGIAGDNKSLNILRYCNLVCERLQFASVVLGRRGHEADIELTVPQMSIFGLQQDIHECLLHIHNKYPNNPLILLGDSAGTGFVVRYTADLSLCTNKQCQDDHNKSSSQYIIKHYENAQSIADSILCIVLISPGYDIGQTFSNQGWLGQKLMLFLVKRTFIKAHNKILRQKNENVIEKCNESSSMFQFFSTYSGSMSGFNSYNEFLLETNPTETAQYAQFPALIINSRDDPICTATSLDEFKWLFTKKKSCPNSILVETKYGSHSAFLSAFGGFWLDSVILEYVQAVYEIKTEITL